METTTPVQILQKKKKNQFILALVFFLISLALSGGLYLYNLSLNSQIDVIQAELQTKEQSIREREAEPLVQSYMLYERSASLLERLGYESDIPTLVAHMKQLALRYGLSMTGWNYQSGALQTSVRSDNDARGFGYEKVTDFISSYRADSEALFELETIMSFVGHDRIEYDMTLNLRDARLVAAAETGDEAELTEVEESEEVGEGDTESVSPEAVEE